MSRRPSTFRQQDVTRALRAATAAGIAVRRIEIGPDGRIAIEAGEAVETETEAGSNPWLEELKR
jgi:hypothetical protein